MQNLIDKNINTALSLSLREAAKIILSHLDKEVTLATIVDSLDPKSTELKDFIFDIASLNDLITMEIYDKGENPAAETLFHADKLPALALLDAEKYYGGVKYHGIPTMQQLIPFALTLYNLAGPGIPLDTGTAERIISVRNPVNIKVCVSLSCPLCADAVASAQRLALLNPRVQAEMIDMDLFPDIQKQYQINSVPALIINDEAIHFDVNTIDEILDVLSL